MMKQDKRKLGTTLIAAVLALTVPLNMATTAGAAALDNIPADSTAEAREIYKQILDDAPGSIVELTEELVVPGEENDSKVRFVLRGLAVYVGSPEGADQREVFLKAMLRQLDSDLAKPVKGFIIRQIHLVGGEESVSALGKCLTDEKLSEYAAHALLAMRDKDVAPVFAKALPKASGACRRTIIQDLGVLQAAKGNKAVLKALSDGDSTVRFAAAYALANSADPAAVEPLLKAADADDMYARSKMTEAALLLARRMGEEGDKKAAERICRHFLETRTTQADVHVYCAALMSLAQSLGADAMDDVLEALNSENLDVSATAIAAAIAMPGEDATQQWTKRLKTAEPGGKISILNLLAQRADPSALPAVLDTIKAPQEKVRLAAIDAVGTVGNEKAAPPLVSLIPEATAVERGAIRSSLLHLTGEGVSAAIAEQLSSAQPAAQIEVLKVLADRAATDQLDEIIRYTASKNEGVSSAAITSLGKLARKPHIPKLVRLMADSDNARVRKATQKALVATCRRLRDKASSVEAIADGISRVEGPARVALLSVLGSIGTRKACEVVQADLDAEDDYIRDAAIRTLADWRDDSPADELLDIARNAEQLNHRVLALRGYVRMIALREDRSAEERLSMCRKALKAAPRQQDKRTVLGAIGDVPTMKALEMAEAHLDDAGLKTEAAVAVIQIARAVSAGNPDRARLAIDKAVKASDKEEVANQANDAIDFIERFQGFITTWKISGPYQGDNRFDKKFPPEDPDAKDVKWKLVSVADRQPAVVDLNKHIGKVGNCVGYMRARIWSPEKQAAQLEIGSDDGVKVWLNDEVIHSKDVPRSLKVGEDKLKVELQKGWNDLLLKVSQGGGDWSGCARVRNAEGGKLSGIKLKAD